MLNLIINSVNFKSEYYQYDDRNSTISSYVRYNEMSKNGNKLDMNNSNYS